MDRRTKILLSLFGAAVGYALFSTMIYPTWVKPLLSLSERVAAAQATLDKLEEQETRLEQAKREYRRLVERAGALDIDKVQNALRARLDQLIIKHRLESAGLTPSRGTADKTGLERMTMTVNGTGTLESVVRFMQDVAELPQLIRVGNVTLYPASGGKRGERADRVNMRLPIEVLVLPQQKALGEKLKDEDFQQPEKIVRHQQRDYSIVWKKTPFTEFVPLPPLVANAGAPQTVHRGQTFSLQGSATGGDGRYTFEWSGDGVTPSESQSLSVDTTTVGSRNYTLAVRDGMGNTASARVTVTIVEPPPPPPLTASAGQPQTVPAGQPLTLQGSATGGDGRYSYEWSSEELPPTPLQSISVDTSNIGPKNFTLVVKDGSGNSASAQVTVTVIEPPPPPKVRHTWPDRAFRQVVMTLQTQGVSGRQGELLVVNQNTRERTYHAVGEDFDGGKLVHVDTRGGIVKWDDNFYIYPLGAKLDQEIPADSATNYPDLLRIVERLKMAEAPPGPRTAPEGDAGSMNGSHEPPPQPRKPPWDMPEEAGTFEGDKHRTQPETGVGDGVAPSDGSPGTTGGGTVPASQPSNPDSVPDQGSANPQAPAAASGQTGEGAAGKEDAAAEPPSRTKPRRTTRPKPAVRPSPAAEKTPSTE